MKIKKKDLVRLIVNKYWYVHSSKSEWSCVFDDSRKIVYTCHQDNIEIEINSYNKIIEDFLSKDD